MEAVIVFLLLLVQTSALSCPEECRCYTQNEKHFSECFTGNLTDTVSQVDPITTHLVLILQSAAYAYDSSDSSPSFVHLENVEGLILDHDGFYCYTKVHLRRSSFPERSKIRVFLSQVQLDLTADALAGMEMMESLTLTTTGVRWEAFPQLMNKSLCRMQKLRKLDLTQFSVETTKSSIQTSFTPEQVFAGCQIESLQELRLRNNGLVKMASAFYLSFPQLSVLDVSYNELLGNVIEIELASTTAQFLFLLFFNNLHTFNFGNQMGKYQQHVPYSAQDLTVPLSIPTPEIRCNRTFNEYLSFKIFRVRHHKELWTPFLKKMCISLQVLILDSLHGHPASRLIIHRMDDLDMILPPLQLQFLDWSDNAQFTVIHMENVRYPHGLEKLEYLNFMRSNFTIFHHKLFTSMKSLRTLLLGHNGLNKKLSTLNVKENSALEVLDLSYNNISEFPSALLDGVSSLQQLNLTGNHLTDLNIIMHSMPNLRLLNISGNNISTLSQSMRSQLNDLTHSLKLDLSGNPLSCGCRDLDFIDWLRTTTIAIHNVHLLSCLDSTDGVHNLKTLDLEATRNKCYPNTLQLIVISVAATFAVTAALSAVIVIYCKRWKLKYWWYITKRSYRQFKSSADTMEYDYDAFLS
ncbi:hypothetical protein CAPTEDRAFT_203987 [Capitella teleta]|uniref:LRRCT domain-containing protein n=1 Tax=Capitella teleta TaxID=283909 RepID=R7UVJ8_CAPTE|nr:hypothetical protein CAPTEDRAFT_203987 [Capitella teleta]|eukprot:ELU10329.1 hypothetical protein CAPTEDRAFT_203987 [Capitella teleta]